MVRMTVYSYVDSEWLRGEIKKSGLTSVFDIGFVPLLFSLFCLCNEFARKHIGAIVALHGKGYGFPNSNKFTKWGLDTRSRVYNTGNWDKWTDWKSVTLT